MPDPDPAAQPPKRKTSVQQALEKSAEVDEIFKDSPVPKGTDPLYPAESAGSGPSAVTSLVEPLPDIESHVDLLRKADALESLFHLINRQSRFNELVRSILSIAMAAVPSEAGSILEIDHRHGRFFFRAVAGRSAEALKKVTIPLGKGVVGYCAANKRSMVVTNADESRVHLKSVATAVQFHCRNMVCVPILIGGEVFGCVELLNRLEQPEFSREDLDVLRSVLDCAALVIENRLTLVRLWEEAHRGPVGKKDAA